MVTVDDDDEGEEHEELGFEERGEACEEEDAVEDAVATATVARGVVCISPPLGIRLHVFALDIFCGGDA